MIGIRKLAVFAAGVAAFSAAPASAQATRTWISGVGDDANPCSRTAPCKTFQGAISKTAQGGEIDCLDPGGFGGVTITKSITLYCPYTNAGVLVAGQNGIIVNDNGANNAHVVIDGFNIEGLGNSTTSPGVRGIYFLSGASLTVRNSVIRGFRDATNGTGISFNPGGAAQLNVENVTLINNGTTGVGGGILVQPTGANGSARVTLENVRILTNANNGFRVDTTGATNAATVSVMIDNTTINGNTNGVVANSPAGTSPISIMLRNSEVANNSGMGLLASGGARLRVGNTAITGNAIGVAFGGGAIVNSYGNNQLNGNTTGDGAFTLPAIGQQ